MIDNFLEYSQVRVKLSRMGAGGNLGLLFVDDDGSLYLFTVSSSLMLPKLSPGYGGTELLEWSGGQRAVAAVYDYYWYGLETSIYVSPPPNTIRSRQM